MTWLYVEGLPITFTFAVGKSGNDALLATGGNKIYSTDQNNFFGLNATKIIRFSIQKMIQRAGLKSSSKMMSKCVIRAAFPCKNDARK